jgi:glycosyltransferase involved in cell wall biosynthesis
MPPVTTGIARDSAELIRALQDDHEFDVFVDDSNVADRERGHREVVPGTTRLRSAHDFVPRHLHRPYDLIVYQLGNSSHHDYEWPYLFRYPGLAVLHDSHLHHARAASLLRTMRPDDYRAEFAANHPGADRNLAELAVAGFDSHIHYSWPMTRLVAETSRMAAVHTAAAAVRLRTDAPQARVEVVRLGHGELVDGTRTAAFREQTRRRYGISTAATVFGCFGGLSPDKRLPQVLAAFKATRAYAPDTHLLLAGSIASHYDLRREIAHHGLEPHCTMTGYIEKDEDLTACIAACDATLNLRWPTAREVSGPWLRCLAAGKPTVTIDLAHMTHVPSIDPRTWRAPRSQAGPACTIAIDIVDEDHSLRLAMRRLALDASLRDTLGQAAQRYWLAHHTPEAMAADYRRVIALAASVEALPRPVPAHVTNRGAGTLRRVMQEFGLPVPLGL